MRQLTNPPQRAASSGEAKGSNPSRADPLLGTTVAPASMDHQVPRPDFAQILARCDLEGQEPIFATPDRSLEPDDYDQAPSSSERVGKLDTKR